MLRFRLYYDKDAEEAWLQKMVEQGWALRHYCMGVYTFAPCEPGDYIYRVDLVPPEAKAGEYEDFLRESGAEPVQRWGRWLYLRRKAAEGPFEVYTDAASKIALYERIRRFFVWVLVLEVACFTLELVSALETGYALFWVFTGLLFLIVMGLVRLIVVCDRKIKGLRRG